MKQGNLFSFFGGGAAQEEEQQEQVAVKKLKRVEAEDLPADVLQEDADDMIQLEDGEGGEEEEEQVKEEEEESRVQPMDEAEDVEEELDEDEEDEDEDDDDEEDDDDDEGGDEEETKKRKRAPEKQKKLSKKQTMAKINRAFDPIKGAGWKRGQDIPYRALADVFAEISSTSSRLLIIDSLTKLFRRIITLSPQEFLTVVYLSTNELGPSYEGLELGIGESIIMKAIGEACGKTMAVVKEEYQTLGDLGLVAMQSRNTQGVLFQPKPLTLKKVFGVFREIAKTSGTRSQDVKKRLIKGLLVAAQGNETQFIVRALQGKMRIGLATKSVQVAIAHAVTLTPPDSQHPPRILDRRTEGELRGKQLEDAMGAAVSTLKEVLSELPSWEALVPIMLDTETVEYGDSIQALRDRCGITAGIPVHPMLAQPTKGISEVLERMKENGFTCEYKYDGERAQIHLLTDPNTGAKSVRVFSRNLEENTSKYPDVIRDFPHAFMDYESCSSVIIDCEAVAWDPVEQKRRPFQILSTRRKKNVDAGDITVRVVCYAFDLLYLNGKSLLKSSFQERRDLLHSTFKRVPDEFDFAQSKDCQTVEEVREFLEQSVKEESEGLMVKTLHHNATYEPSRRSYNWLKVKKDYLAGMTDSLDLVPIGAWLGKGKRTGTFGGYLMACFNDEDEEFQSIAVLGTGFKDEDLKNFTAYFDEESQLPTKPHNYIVGAEGKQGKPDVWLKAKTVWEVKAADFSISPVHQAGVGLVDENKGIALRFPRFLRVRDDKGPEQATSAEQVAQMYRNQFESAPQSAYGVDADHQSLANYNKNGAQKN